MTFGNVPSQEAPKIAECAKHQWQAISSTDIDYLPPHEDDDYPVWFIETQTVMKCIHCGELDTVISSRRS
jgi:hypothetical protein